MADIIFFAAWFIWFVYLWGKEGASNGALSDERQAYVHSCSQHVHRPFNRRG